MKIVADENIPFVKEAFGSFGNLVACPGRLINSSLLKEADILLIRSVTRVDKQLLKGTKVRFVASATIGCDHVDSDYLAAEGIRFVSAAGANANSVAEYIVAALLVLSRRHEFSLSQKTIGVVGVGNVGSRVVKKAHILNMTILQNDPPLKRKTPEERFRPLEELLAQADFLTLHVPLTYEGQDATYHIGDNALFEKMKDGSFLINTSRGAVVNNQDLALALKERRLSAAVLDVWEGEPEIDEGLLGAVDLATPHIAGYSLDGKSNATVLIYEATCHFLNVACEWHLPELPPHPSPHIEVDGRGRMDEELLSEIVRQAYDLERDDQNLRHILQTPLHHRKEYFDRLRNNYPVRREFNSISINIKGATEGVKQKLSALGFHLQEDKYTANK